MKPIAKGDSELSSIDVDIGVRGSCNHWFAIGIYSLLLDSPAKCAPFLCAYCSTGDSLKLMMKSGMELRRLEDDYKATVVQTIDITD
jgi:hypothetical protein